MRFNQPPMWMGILLVLGICFVIGLPLYIDHVVNVQMADQFSDTPAGPTVYTVQSTSPDGRFEAVFVNNTLGPLDCDVSLFLRRSGSVTESDWIDVVFIGKVEQVRTTWTSASSLELVLAKPQDAVVGMRVKNDSVTVDGTAIKVHFAPERPARRLLEDSSTRWYDVDPTAVDGK